MNHTHRFQRIGYTLTGVVQGVGFRPWVSQHAKCLGLSGWTGNDEHGLNIEIQGSCQALDAFESELRHSPPPLAHIKRIERHELALVADEQGFVIAQSLQGQLPTASVPADTAPCEACLEEMFTPANRRWRHPFINCTHCGPRFSVIERLPYDRPFTSMADFPMCEACASEYRDSSNRRYHAQPIACPHCGPRIALLHGDGTPMVSADEGTDAVIAAAAMLLRKGGIIAMKNVGGYHLVADACRQETLVRLRQAKRRPTKPFALMVANLASAERWVEVDANSAAALQDPSRPIVVLPCHAGIAASFPTIAPGLNEWGLMLPSNPLQWLLLHELAGSPQMAGWRQHGQDALLVMTSANHGGEPLVSTEEDALSNLAGIADALLVHDRRIVTPQDDSVRRPREKNAHEGGPVPFIRRARGYVPDPIELPNVAEDAPSVIGLGGYLKATVCLTRGNEAFLSSHLGDQGDPHCRQQLVSSLRQLKDFLGITPECITHDKHPDYFSTRLAAELSEEWHVPALGVQHHHAHTAAVLAEHGVSTQALGIVLDGTGYGDDGLNWGGELLKVSGANHERLGHLPLLAQPGGDRAAREPWRMGAALLYALDRGDEIPRRFSGQHGADDIAGMIASGFNSAPTSSAGRLFDAAAALIDDIHHIHYEGEAAMRLEALASNIRHALPWADGFTLTMDGTLSFRGMWYHLANASYLSSSLKTECAARFHATLARALVQWAIHHARQHDVRHIALAGGSWINRLLRNAVVSSLQSAGFIVHEAEQLPCGDGGLSFGQATVALQHLGKP